VAERTLLDLPVIFFSAPQPNPLSVSPPAAAEVSEEPWSMAEVDHPMQCRIFPPTFQAQPPESMQVYSGQPIKFEPCHAKWAKKYQWFKGVDGGDLLVHESDHCGAFEVN
jgi:hypothetical protein